MRTHIVLAACLTAIATPAFGQSFNVDVDSTAVGTWQGAPAATFGGGAAQPGAWNAWLGLNNISITLNDLSGAPTAVTITAANNQGTGGSGNPSFATDNAATTGDVQLLMDDGWDLSGTVPQTYTIAGLAAGTYEIYTYCWAPDFPADMTLVTIAGATPESVTVGNGAAGNTLTTPGHYAVQTITIAAGNNIVISPDGSAVGQFGTVNGFQIKKLGGGSCAGDVTGNGTVDVDDLVQVILSWGQPDSSGVVDVDDLVGVILGWGPCP